MHNVYYSPISNAFYPSHEHFTKITVELKKYKNAVATHTMDIFGYKKLRLLSNKFQIFPKLQ